MIKSILLAIVVLGVLGGLFGALLAFASKIFHVEVDPKQAQIRECLAGANCGGCGYPGCDGYAAAVAAGEAPTAVPQCSLAAEAARCAPSPASAWETAPKPASLTPCT